MAGWCASARSPCRSWPCSRPAPRDPEPPLQPRPRLCRRTDRSTRPSAIRRRCARRPWSRRRWRRCGPTDLRRCVDEFQQGPERRFVPPAHGTLADRGIGAAGRRRGFRPSQRGRARPQPGARRRVAGPDRLSGPAALDGCAPTAPSPASPACSTTRAREVAYRHAYALDTCRRAIPPERDLATVVPLRVARRRRSALRAAPCPRRPAPRRSRSRSA